MLSVGNDILLIKRMERSLKNPRFIARVFGIEEQKELSGRPSQSYAAAFSAKESFAKALGTGIRGFSFRDVQLLHNDLGAPYLKLDGNAKLIADEKNMDFCMSVSHCSEYVNVIVIGYPRGLKL